MTPLLVDLACTDAEKGEHARAWLRDGWRAWTSFRGNAAMVFFYSPTGAGQHHISNVSLDELSVLADFAQSIAHPDARRLAADAWLLQHTSTKTIT